MKTSRGCFTGFEIGWRKKLHEKFWSGKSEVEMFCHNAIERLTV